jgi:DNA polymerase III psi subunit
MLSSRQQAYLEAMDIEVWNLRAAVPGVTAATTGHAQLKLGPGRGGVLLVCATDSESAGRLANDINRSLGGAPVWAWPVGDADGISLDCAVEENLFITVAFFGRQLAQQFFAGEPPAHCKSATLVVLPSMQELQRSGGARRTLWRSICRSGMIDPG